MRFFDPEASLVIHRGKLPHWRQEGVIYFVTFHLADSLPQTTLEWLRPEKDLWLRLNPEPHTESQWWVHPRAVRMQSNHGIQSHAL